MRRTDREIKDRELISQIIEHCQVCRLGLAKDGVPYIVPVSFGYDGSAIYFHTATEGKKIDFIAVNNAMCFEFEHGVRVMPDDTLPCKWSFSYESVIGNGRVQELVGTAERIAGLAQIMKQYSDREWELDERKLENLRVWKITIETIAGKQSQDKIPAS